MLHFLPPDQPRVRPPACGKPPLPQRRGRRRRRQRKRGRPLEVPRNPVTEEVGLSLRSSPRCVTSCPGACSPAHRGPAQEPGRPGMVTSVSGNDPGAWPGYTLFRSSSGSKYRPRNADRSPPPAQKEVKGLPPRADPSPGTGCCLSVAPSVALAEPSSRAETFPELQLGPNPMP